MDVERLKSWDKISSNFLQGKNIFIQVACESGIKPKLLYCCKLVSELTYLLEGMHQKFQREFQEKTGVFKGRRNVHVSKDGHGTRFKFKKSFQTLTRPASRLLRRTIPQTGHLMMPRSFWMKTTPNEVGYNGLQGSKAGDLMEPYFMFHAGCRCGHHVSPRMCGIDRAVVQAEDRDHTWRHPEGQGHRHYCRNQDCTELLLHPTQRLLRWLPQGPGADAVPEGP